VALFRAHVRALLRASAAGPLRTMVPMISCVEEAVWVRGIVDEEKKRLAEAGKAFDSSMPLGAMIEVPSAAFLIDRLSAAMDFFSIGSNDLLQYFAAADRSDPRVDRLASPASPAFARLLHKIVGDAHARGRRVSLCGEMAGDTRCLPLLAGLGLDGVSMAPPLIAAAKAELSGMTLAHCEQVLQSAMAAATGEEVRRLLDGAHAHPSAPVVTRDLVVIGSEARTKAEAIKEAVDRLYVAGRTDRPRDVEDAVWNAESDRYSTGFGHGVAMPHGRTDAVRSNSLVVLKLRQPIAWGSADGRPVGIVILLATRQSDVPDAHLAIMSTLARCLVQDECRQRIEAEDDADAVCRLLADTVCA
jgi:fructose-specific PTS system IIA-like component